LRQKSSSLKVLPLTQQEAPAQQSAFARNDQIIEYRCRAIEVIVANGMPGIRDKRFDDVGRQRLSCVKIERTKCTPLYPMEQTSACRSAAGAETSGHP
jgi:hypothetical protein